jgi:YggT family protein
MIQALVVAFATIFLNLLTLYKWVIIISALLSWIQPDPYNPIVQMLNRLTQPAYDMLRKVMPTVFGGLDFAPIVLIFAIQFLEVFMANLFQGLI